MANSPSSSGRGKGRRALGRGLDVLLPTDTSTGLREVEVDRIEPNPDQPRRRFDRKALEDLAASIQEHGIVQPLIVSSVSDDRYRLIVGERRWQAARIAGVERVPVIVKDASDRDTLELALVENLQRADLNPLEEAAAFQRLVQDFGLTQEAIARRIGRSRVAITNTLRLLALPETLKRAVIEERVTEGHARAILGHPDQHVQLALLERVERDDMSVRQTEELVRRLADSAQSTRRKPERDPNFTAVEDQLRRALGTKVTLRPGKRGGRIVIEYYSDEEFQSLYDRLVGED